MNGEVLNGIFKRRPARDFLRLYPSEKWKEIIPDVFEIGVLNLKNSFGTLQFSKNDLKNILDELRNYNFSTDLHEQDESLKKCQNNYRSNNINNNNNFNFTNENSNYIEEIEENNNNNEYNNEIDDENYDNNYEDGYCENHDNNNKYNNDKINQKISKKDDKKGTSNIEVFIPDIRKINNNYKYNRQKISYNSTFEEIKEKNIENKRNIGYTESKIKYQIMNDKMNHKANKKRNISNDENNENDGSFSFNQNKNNRSDNKKEKNTNKNYLINFDKNLYPEKPIEIKKPHEINRNTNSIKFFNMGNCKQNNLNDEYENNNTINNYNEDKIFTSNDYINNNIYESNNNQMSLGEQLNNFKIENIKIPKYEYKRGFNNK